MMTFGVVTITQNISRHPNAKLYDCGKYGMLTARQIAVMAGITQNAVARRHQSGVRGAALCGPKNQAQKGVRAKCSNTVIGIAVKLVKAFPDRTPSVRQILDAHPMCKRNAQRWRQALNDARPSE